MPCGMHLWHFLCAGSERGGSRHSERYVFNKIRWKQLVLAIHSCLALPVESIARLTSLDFTTPRPDTVVIVVASSRVGCVATL
jgi:hypothetical protein